MTNTKKKNSEYKVAQTYRGSGRWFEVYRLLDPAKPDKRSNRVVRYACRDRCMAARVAAAANKEADRKTGRNEELPY